MYGFGDSISRGTTICNLSRENKAFTTFDQVLATYQTATPYVTLSGPTNFCPIIARAVEIAQTTNSHCLLVMFALRWTEDGTDTKIGRRTGQRVPQNPPSAPVVRGAARECGVCGDWRRAIRKAQLGVGARGEQLLVCQFLKSATTPPRLDCGDIADCNVPKPPQTMFNICQERCFSLIVLYLVSFTEQRRVGCGDERGPTNSSKHGGCETELSESSGESEKPDKQNKRSEGSTPNRSQTTTKRSITLVDWSTHVWIGRSPSADVNRALCGGGVPDDRARTHTHTQHPQDLVQDSAVPFVLGL